MHSDRCNVDISFTHCLVWTLIYTLKRHMINMINNSNYFVYYESKLEWDLSAFTTSVLNKSYWFTLYAMPYNKTHWK